MKVSIRIFDEDERKFLETILDLAARRLKVSLEHVVSGVAEVVFLKADEPGASLLINASQVRSRPVVVVYGGTGHRWTLSKPATSKLLVELLGRLMEELDIAPADSPPGVIATPQRMHDEQGAQFSSRPAASAAPATAASQAVDAEVRVPAAAQPESSDLPPLLPVTVGQPFMERIREIAAAGNGRWVCNHDSSFVLCIDAAAGKVMFPGEYASRHPELGRMSLAIADTGIRQLADGERWSSHATAASMPLESFLWLVAQIAEPVALEEGAPLLSQRFRLQRWPSFSRILHGSSHIVMSGRLMKRAMSLHELVDVTGERIENVMRFYNSACICGLLQTVSVAGMESAAPVIQVDAGSVDAAQLQEIRKGKAGIFSRVLKRLLG